MVYVVATDRQLEGSGRLGLQPFGSLRRLVVLGAPYVTMSLATGCMAGTASATASTPGGGGLISLSGSIGAVQLGVSTEADVKAAIGAPEATAVDTFQFDGAPRYKALGYGCTSTKARNGIALTYYATTGPYCQTVYYMNLSKGVLGSFWTASTAFHTARGTRVGMATGVAAKREKQTAANGCHIGFAETSAKLILVVDITGYRQRLLHPRRNDHLARPTGGHVASFEEDSRKSGVGLLFC